MNIKTLSALTLAVPLLTWTGTATADLDSSASWEEGAEWAWQRDRYLRVGGRMHYDIARYDDDVTPLNDDEGFRRSRVNIRGRYEDWRLRLDRDFGISDGFRSAFVQYAGWRRTRVTLGNQVAPFSLGDLVGSNDMTLPDRSLVNALSPGMLTGASVRRWGDDWTFTGGVFGNELNDQDRRTIDGTSFIGRVSYTPVREKRRVLHLGLAQELRTVNNDNQVRVRTRPESRLARERLVSTPRLDGVDQVYTTGLEFMAILDNVRLQGEHMLMTFDGLNADLDGSYAQASWVITGEGYRYSRSRGVFNGIRPKGRWGALELSARYSTLDLSEADGGQQDQWSAALSWYPRPPLRTTLAYSRFDAQPNADGVDESGSVLTLRLQYAFE